MAVSALRAEKLAVSALRADSTISPTLFERKRNQKFLNLLSKDHSPQLDIYQPSLTVRQV